MAGRKARWWGWGLGCWLEGDGVVEGLELSDQVAGFAVGVVTFGVVVRAEVDVAGVGVVEEVPDDDKDGSGDCDEGPLFASSPG